MKKKQIHIKLIFKVLGFILSLESVLLLLSAFVSIYYKDDSTRYLLFCSGLTFVFGAALSYIGYNSKIQMIEKRDSILMISLSWILFSIFGMIPFYISNAIPSITDAFFETVSGLTTTGSSILENIEALPQGLLFWRSLIQWIGGLGMIVFVLAFLPMVADSGTAHLLEDETTGVPHDKFRPKVGQIAKRLWGIYLFFTALLTILLWIGPMDLFDACNHAFSTMSTGGFSTKNASIAHWDSAYIDYVISIFMLVGSINFTMWYFMFKGNFSKLLKDEELRWFLSITAGVTIVITCGLYFSHQIGDLPETFRHSFFQVSSLISTSGFVTKDFTQWGPFYIATLTIIMIICGCGGSTCGGLKTIRFAILSKTAINELNKQLHPKAIILVRINKNVVSADVVQRILAFAFLYMSTIFIGIVALTATGLTFEESWGAAITSISNIGPGLGSQAGNFHNTPDLSKWVCSLLMLVGRLELFPIMLLFTPGFWKS